MRSLVKLRRDKQIFQFAAAGGIEPLQEENSPQIMGFSLPSSPGGSHTRPAAGFTRSMRSSFNPIFPFNLFQP